MKKIDFLPGRYHERNAARHASVARLLAAGAILLGLAPLAGFQYWKLRAARRSAAEVKPLYQLALAQSKKLTELNQELEIARGEAALLAYLNHPWPRTTVLAQVHAPLPESIRLTSFRLAAEPKAAGGQGNAGRQRGGLRSSGVESATEDTSPLAVRDLKALADQHQQHDHTVTLAGFTTNSTDLHAYVARLRLPGLFVKSELKSLETLPGQENVRAQKFEVRLVLAPGYGKLPDAPMGSKPDTRASQLPDATLAQRP
jgi:hypothetical protein